MTTKINIGYDERKYAPRSEVPDADTDYGPCVKCVCTGDDVVENYSPVMPTKLGARLTLTYENGTELEVLARFTGLLFYGTVPFWTDDARFCNISDKRVRAAIAKAAAELRPFGEGEVKLPTDGEAASILAECAVPDRPIEADNRPGIEEAWFQVWKEDGLLVKMSDGQWIIESALPKEFEDEKFAKWRFGREWRFQGAGGIVALCNGTVRNWDELDDAEKALLAWDKEDYYRAPTEEELVTGDEVDEFLRTKGKSVTDRIEKMLAGEKDEERRKYLQILLDEIELYSYSGLPYWITSDEKHDATVRLKEYKDWVAKGKPFRMR